MSNVSSIRSAEFFILVQHSLFSLESKMPSQKLLTPRAEELIFEAPRYQRRERKGSLREKAKGKASSRTLRIDQGPKRSCLYHLSPICYLTEAVTSFCYSLRAHRIGRGCWRPTNQPNGTCQCRFFTAVSALCAHTGN